MAEEKAEGIQVVTTDLATGETGVKQIGPGQYVLICAEPLQLRHTRRFSNGTVVLTLGRES